MNRLNSVDASWENPETYSETETRHTDNPRRDK